VTAESEKLSTSTKTIFDYADGRGVRIPSSCGRVGQCHECVVEITQNSNCLNNRSEVEEFLSGEFRLACQASFDTQSVPPEFKLLWQKPRILESSTLSSASSELDPVIRSDGRLVYEGSTSIGSFRSSVLGLVIDLGTTTVVMELVDLSTGQVRTSRSFENPQRFGGSDIMNRISYDGTPTAAGELQKAVIAVANRQVRQMTKEIGCSPAEVYEIVVVGNTTMRDLIFGLDVQPIGQRPYKSLTETEKDDPDASTALTEKASHLGFRVHREAKVHGLPLLASHLGADTVAGMLAVGMLGNNIELDDPSETVMLVDVGTNTEVVLRHEGNFYGASCPAGPAFEGGQVSCGMRAYEGAIEAIRLDEDGKGLSFSTIGDAEPKGFCGSGLIDLLAELVNRNIIDEFGVFLENPKLSEFTILEDYNLKISRQDISNLAQAKSANYSGQFLTLLSASVDPVEVDRLYLAGAFANYINVENACSIGLVAPVLPKNIERVGNAALHGARMALLSQSQRSSLNSASSQIKHIELETMPQFFEVFVEGCQLKAMPDRIGASVQ